MIKNYKFLIKLEKMYLPIENNVDGILIHLAEKVLFPCTDNQRTGSILREIKNFWITKIEDESNYNEQNRTV